MKRLIFLFGLVVYLEALTVVPPPYGQLKITGQHLTKQDGTPVQLRGMSLYTSDDPYLGSMYWNYETMQKLKCYWNVNAVRLPLIVEYNGFLKSPDENYRKVVDAIEDAISTGIYVIVDWHDFTDHLNVSLPFFANISALYGQYPHVIYETYNEPSWADSWDDLKNYHIPIINAIRANDPDNIIVVGTPKSDVDVDIAAAAPINMSNIAYTLHWYTNLPEVNLEKAKNASSMGLPIFVTEYGVCDAHGNGTVNANVSNLWYKYMDANQISYLAWALTDASPGCYFALIPDTTIDQVGDKSRFTESGAFINTKLWSTDQGIVCSAS